MASIGEELAQARVAKELTPKDVERYIKIRAKHISSMEADDFSDIPGQAYVLGFLKSYADFVGLDGTAMQKRYREEQDTEGEAQSKQEATDFIAPGDKEARPQRSLILLLLMIALIGAGWFGYGLLSATKSASSSTATKKLPTKMTPATARQFTITIKVRKPGGSWLIIDADGKRSYNGILAVGERSWSAGSEIRVEAKNAQAFEVLRDGKSKGPLGLSPAAVTTSYKIDES